MFLKRNCSNLNAFRFMDSEPITDSAKCCQYCNCNCSMTAHSSENCPLSTKRKHDELEYANQSSPSELDDSIALVDIEDECAALREAVTSQQQAIKDLMAELEEERNAASSAASEAMSMILRLQKEKAEVQMEARQFMRFAEEKSSQDQKDMLELEDLLYKREQVIQSLNCQVQAYKHRMMSFGFTESEADCDEFEIPPYNEYPPLRCNVIPSNADAEENGDADVEKYVFGETPRDRLRNLENRISHMERTTPTYSQMDGDFTGKNFLEKVAIGQSPRRAKHSKRFSSFDSASLGPELLIDSPKLNSISKKIDEENPNLKKIDTAASETGDVMCDRVYTIDSVYNGVTEFKSGEKGIDDDFENNPMEHGNHDDDDFEDPYVKKLCMRLQALEADRESMRQAIISMRTDKAQVMLLKEIAQQLCKEMSPQRKSTLRSPFSMPFMSVFKWVASIVLRRKNSHQMKHMFGLPTDTVGLLMLLDKEPQVKTWRYLTNTQLED